VCPTCMPFVADGEHTAGGNTHSSASLQVTSAIKAFQLTGSIIFRLSPFAGAPTERAC
jgi:hypothetical protein